MKTENVESVLAKILEGENAEELLSSLKPAEKELFYQLLGCVREDGDASLIEQLWRVDYTKKPPSISEFLHDDYWLGSVTRPDDDNSGIFPVWKNCLEQDFDLDSRIHNLVITGSLGIGKCLAPGTEVMLYHGGYRKVEDLREGDLLMGDDSTPRRVTGLTTGTDEMFEIVPFRPKNGPTFTCNSEHILCLKDDRGRTIDISVKDYLKSRKKLCRYKLYRAPVKYKKAHVTIDPYRLGLWLGDGSTDGTHNVLLNQLRSYGLAVSRTTKKFIPLRYMINSQKVRKELLAGLIDSDGGKYCEGCYGIGLANKDLAEQIVELARSLGYMAAIKLRKVCDQHGTPFDSWTAVVSGAHDIPVKLRHKKSFGRSAQNRRSTARTGFNIIPKGRGKYYGFQLDGNHRFLLKGHYVSHNTWLMGVIFLYRVAAAVLLRNPQNFLGLSKGSSIVYAVLSVTGRVVEETAFGDVKNFMEKSPFFREECHFNPELKYSSMRIQLPNNIMLTAGSKGQHVIGRNTMGVCLDEGNWRLEANPDLKAYKLYDEVRTRIKNRFQKVAGFLPAISVLASSARDESSFTEKVIKDIERVNDEKTEKVYRYAVYEAKRHLLTLKPRWFKVAHGVKNIDPVVLGGWYTEKGMPIDVPGTRHEHAPPGCRISLVPEDYADAFKRNCKTALQSICGISTGGSHLLFQSTADIERCLELAEVDGVQNAAKVEMMPISMEDQSEIWDYLDHRKFCATRYSQIVPARHPEALRFAHLDLATATTAGVAICHLVGNKRVDGLVKSGVVYNEYRQVVEYDFILAIVAGKTKPISLEKIQRFFFWLRQECGFKFGLITADTFQSVMPLQMMQSRGFETKVLSVDRSKAPYYAWRTGFEELRIRPCRNRQMMIEAEQLLDLPEKIDHPAEGCFVPNTMVRMLNGTHQEIKNLVGLGKVWVYANDGKGNVVPAEAEARYTKTVDKLAVVELDNGKTIECTLDHRFMLRDGAYKQAQHLACGDSLMPLYTRVLETQYAAGVGRYEQVKTGGKWVSTHLLVSRTLGFGPRDGEVIHHYDLNPRNNVPGNLKRLTRSEHAKVHKHLAKMASDPEVVKRRVRTFKERYSGNVEFSRRKSALARRAHSKMSPETRALWILRASASHKGKIPSPLCRKLGAESFTKWNKSPIARKKSSERMRKLNLSGKLKTKKWLDNHRKLIAAALKKRMAREDEAAMAKVVSHGGVSSPQEAKKLFGGGLNSWKRRLSQFNHKVVKVSIIDRREKVYDLEVPGYENFGLSAGVFVHNSKDVTDACAASYFSAVSYAQEHASPSGLEPAVHPDSIGVQDDSEAPPIDLNSTPPARRPMVFEA